MCKVSFLQRLLSMAPVGAMLILQSCGLFGGGGGSTDGGNVVGVQGREGWVAEVPFGMKVIPAGTFHMGQADEDVAASQINMNKQVTVSGYYMDDTEISNNEYRQFMDAILLDSLPNLGEPFVMNELYPDTTVWTRDFAHHMGDPMMEYYYWHPGYDDYPVVGVDWEAANYFCEWRTDYLNAYRSSIGQFDMPSFRLPTEAEWEYAARGGRDLVKYPWGNPYIRNAKGCLIANFKPGRGNFYDDGHSYTAPVDVYFPNDFGLFNMAGNVSEWTLDAFNPSATIVAWDLNPKYEDDSEPRKVVRGGSWKDIAYYLETGTRTFEYKDSSRAYIGFRCAMNHIGRSSGIDF